MNLIISEVKSDKDLIRFIKSQWHFYNGDPCFVPPVIADRKKLLNTKKNPFFNHAEMKLFMAEENGIVKGRIGAIINNNHDTTHNEKAGFFGFFECENKQSTADALFTEAEKWLKDKGVEIIYGPENPSLNDEAGLLIDGFDTPPIILMSYNPEYYIDLIENAGYIKAKDLYAYSLYNEDYKTEKIKNLYDSIIDRTKVKIRQFKFNDKTQFLKDMNSVKEIYNSAWEPNWGFVRWTEEEFNFIASDIKQIADERLVLLAEIDGKPVGFGLAIPNVNEALIFNKRGSMVGALWHLVTKKKKIQWCRIVALGIIPQYQKSGLDAVLYFEIGTIANKIGYFKGEASWILEDNEKMKLGLTKTMNSTLYKTYRIYYKKI